VENGKGKFKQHYSGDDWATLLSSATKLPSPFTLGTYIKSCWPE